MLVKESLPRQMFKILKEEIIFQENPNLLMGYKFNEAEIAKRFGCSVTPVRECMNMLRQTGLIVGESYQSSSVVRFDAKRVSEAFELRACLELWALDKAFSSLGENEIAKMKRIQVDYKNAYLNFNQREIVQYNWDFHLVTFEKADNNLFTELIRTIEDQISMMRAPIAKRRKADNDIDELMIPIKEHDEIILAFEEHNKEKAEAALLAHVNRIKDDCLSLYSN